MEVPEVNISNAVELLWEIVHLLMPPPHHHNEGREALSIRNLNFNRNRILLNTFTHTGKLSVACNLAYIIVQLIAAI